MMGASCLLIIWIFFGYFCYNQEGIQKSFITSSSIKTMSLLQIVVVDEDSLADKNSVSCRDDDDELPHIIVAAVHHFTTRHHDIEGMVIILGVLRCLHTTNIHTK